jgi:DNA-binding response OmpR family regulator
MPNLRKILIVDDDPELCDALREQLSLYEEFEVVAAENGLKRRRRPAVRSSCRNSTD